MQKIVQLTLETVRPLLNFSAFFEAQQTTMFWVLESILPYLNINKEVTKDNVTFRILTELAFGTFMACSILVGSTSFIGEAITCTGYKNTDDTEDTEFANTYCWIHGTRDLVGKIASEECQPADSDIEDNKTRNLYYQWVVFMLFFSAILFKIPTWTWSSLENGLMKLFSSENHDILNQNETEMEEKAEMHASSFRKIKGRNMTMFYYIKFMICQGLAGAILILNFYLTNLFLDGDFDTYGWDVYEYWKRKDISTGGKDPMCLIFPTKVGCNVVIGDSSGNPQVKNIYCILSQNIINEKIYLFLWFWFCAMIALLAFQIALEIIIFVSPLVRNFLIMPSWDLTQANQRFLATCTIGDWFVLYQISKNNHHDYFSTFLGKLSEGYDKIAPPENHCDPTSSQSIVDKEC